MFKEFNREERELLKTFILEILMATLDDNVIANGAKLDAIIASLAALAATGIKTDETAVLAALTGVQNTANAILAQDSPTPVVIPPALTPTVTNVLPADGAIAGGTVVTVSGTNFTGATGVMFGLVAGTNLNVTSDTSLTVISPAQPAGVVDVTVVDAAGTSAISPNGKYTYP